MVYIGIMQKKMETTILYSVQDLGLCFGFGLKARLRVRILQFGAGFTVSGVVVPCKS